MRRISLTLVPAFVVLAIPGYALAQTPARPPAQSPASLAPAAGPDGVMLVFARFADVDGGRLVAAFDSIPAGRYDYRPTPAQQSLGYIAQHLEDANYALCERFSDLKHPRAAQDSLADTVKARWPKDTLVERLRASLRFCDSALDRAGGLRSAALAARPLARGAREVRRSVPARTGVRAAADAQGRLALRPGEHRERAGAALARVAPRLLRQGGRCAGHVQVGRARRGHRARDLRI